MSEKATLAGGCFWCVEAVFKEVKGVSSVVSGYAGGRKDNPTYEDMQSPDNTHAETIQITFDPNIISFEKILEIFYSVHDPTTLNRQGNDVGVQYRSAIFYHDDKQKQIAENVTENYAKKHWSDPIVTEITKLDKFWPAENYHQDYFANNQNNPYCQIIINPKLEKFRTEFKQYLK